MAQRHASPKFFKELERAADSASAGRLEERTCAGTSLHVARAVSLHAVRRTRTSSSIASTLRGVQGAAAALEALRAATSTATSAKRSARSSCAETFRRRRRRRRVDDDAGRSKTAMEQRHQAARLDERRQTQDAGAREAARRSPTRSAIPTSGATTSRSTIERDDFFGNVAARDDVRVAARARQDRQAGRPRRVGHDAADRQRLLQPADERHQLPGRRAAAAALRPEAGRRAELRQHRRDDRPRADARLRRRRPPVRRARAI